MNRYRVREYNDIGYSPVVCFESWRVAILNYIDELELSRIDNFQKHDFTDEVFVLLEGECTLFFADYDGTSLQNFEAVKMYKNKLYTVKKGVYHTHTLSKDGKVLIVENDNTSDDNSPKVYISDEDRRTMQNLLKNGVFK